MANRSTGTDERTTTSPWPFLIAVGLVAGEIGVWFSLVPIAVGGLALFGASVAGLVAESTPATSPWPIGAGLGLFFIAAGVSLYAIGTGVLTIGETDVLVGLAVRGVVIAVAGMIVLLGTVIGRYWVG